MRLTARQLEVFQMAYRLKSTRKAADALHISQPAVSRAVAEIEAQIGVLLFDRAGRKFQPTLAANSLFEAVQQHYHGLDRVLESAKMIAEGTTGHLKVVALPAVADVLVARAAGRLMANHPHLRIDIDVLGEQECLTAIKSGSADCAVVSTDPGEAGLYCQLIASITPVVGVPSASSVAQKSKITAKELVANNLIMLPHDSPFRQATEKALSKAALKFTIRAEARTQSALLELVDHGIGFAIIGSNTIHAELHPKITLLPFPLEMIWPIRVLMPASVSGLPTAKLFLTEISAK